MVDFDNNKSTNNRSVSPNKATNNGESVHRSKLHEIKSQDYLGILWRGKWILLGAIILGFIISIIYLHVKNPLYEATASVLINARLVESSNLLDPFRGNENDKNLTLNELNILKSQSLAYEVATRLFQRRYLDSANQQLLLIIQAKPHDSSRATATLEQIAARLRSLVDAEVTPSTDIIQITAMSEDPREAALLANFYARAYYDRNLQLSRAKTRIFREFLEKQVSDKQHILRETEDSLQHYMQIHGIVLLDDESKKRIDQLSRLEAERDEVDINIQSVSKTLSSYEQQLPEQVKNISQAIGEANDPYIRLLQEQIAKMEVARDVMVAQNPSVVGSEIYKAKLKETDDQIIKMRNNLEQRTKIFLKSLNPGTESGTETAVYLKQFKLKIAEAKIDLEALQTRKSALNSAIQQYDIEFSQIPLKSLEYSRLLRMKLGQEKLFVTIQEKYNEATITEQSQFGYIDIVDHAVVPVNPSRPKSQLIFFIGSMIGLGCGIIMVFAKERLDPRIQSPEDLKNEGYSVLGTVIHVNDKLMKPGERPLFTLTTPFSPAAEAFRQLRTNLRYAHREQNYQSIVVTSSVPGEGKTTIVANLGLAFSQEGKSVLLIDADLRKPSLQASFGLTNEPGITDYLEGKLSFQSAIKKTEFENLHVITAGCPTNRPTEILDTDLMQQAVKEAKSNYNVVIFDSSPIFAGSDSSILSTLVDGVLMVVSSGHTRLADFHQAVEQLTEIKGKAPGIVLNNFDLHRAYGIVYGRSGYGYYRYSRKYKKDYSTKIETKI